jgi:hypothetical protein
MLRVVAFAFVAVSANASRIASAALDEVSVSVSIAQQWMKTHNADPNDQAGMNDLKASDPNAFAIVQALLAKQQLGLLDPKHPTANFAGKHEDTDSQSAIDVLKAAPTVDAPMAPVAALAAVHHTYSGSSMWNYNAHRKSEDDALVAGVMGDVIGSSAPLEYEVPQSAPATGSLLSSRRATVQSSALSGDMATFGFGGQHSMATAEAQQDERPAPVVHKSTSFDGMPNLDWGSRYAGSDQQSQAEPAPVQASMSQRMSTVASVAPPIAQPAPAPVQKQAANPYLNGIDFSSDMSTQSKKQASMAQQKRQTRKASPEELANNPYLEGIDLGQRAPAKQPQMEAPTPEASLSQKASYLDQIGFPMPHRHVQEPPRTPKDLANPLTDFSWHGEDQIARPKAVQTTMMQKVEEGVTAARINGPLTDWLAPDDSAPRVFTAQIQEDEPSSASVDPMAIDKYNNWVQYGN